MKLDIYIEDRFGDTANVYTNEDGSPFINMSVTDDLLIFNAEQARELADALIEAAKKLEG